MLSLSPVSCCPRRASNVVSIKNAKLVTLLVMNEKHILLQFITCFLPVRYLIILFLCCQCLVNQVCHLGDIVCTIEKHYLSQIPPIVPYVIEDVYGLHNPCVRPMLSRAIVALSAAFAAQIRTIIRRRQKSEAKVECNRFATPLKRCCRPPPPPQRQFSR